MVALRMSQLATLLRSNGLSLVTVALALAVSFGIGAVLIAADGVNPLIAYALILEGAYGDSYRMAESLIKMTTLLLIGLGIVVSFRCAIWNIGAEGQFLVGALAGTWFAITFPTLPFYIMVPGVLLLSIVGGGIWSGVLGILKAKLEVSEVITSLMMNYIGFWFFHWAISGPMQDLTSPGWAITPAVAEAARLPILIQGTRLHAGVIVAFLGVVAVYFLMWKTTVGFQIRACGLNMKASLYAGINVPRTAVLVTFISGAFAGLAGAIEMMGFQYRLMEGFSPGYGGMGIIVALLGKLNPVGAGLAAFLFGGLLVGADTMGRITGISIFLVAVLQGIIVIIVLAAEHWKFFKERYALWLLRRS